MIIELNEVLHYLEQQKGRPVTNKTKFALRLNLTIPSNQLDKTIQQLNQEGYIHIFFHHVKREEKRYPVQWDRKISFDLSQKGIDFLGSGGYNLNAPVQIAPNSVVNF